MESPGRAGGFPILVKCFFVRQGHMVVAEVAARSQRRSAAESQFTTAAAMFLLERFIGVLRGVLDSDGDYRQTRAKINHPGRHGQ